MSEQTAIISLQKVNLLDFVSEMTSVYCAIWPGSFNKREYVSCLNCRPSGRSKTELINSLICVVVTTLSIILISTVWRTAIFEKLTVAELIKKFSIFHLISQLMTILRIYHLSFPCNRLIHLICSLFSRFNI